MMVNELDKRLELDLDEVLGSPKLKVKLSPGELDKILLELYINVSEGPGADVLRMIGGGANVGRQKYYMKQQALRTKRLQHQSKKDKASELTFVPPQFLEDVGTGDSSTITKLIKNTLKRNYSKNPNEDATLKQKSGSKAKSSAEKDTTTMTQSMQGYHRSKSTMLYSIPKPSFLQKAPPFRSKFPTPLI